jgi:hypothetical protein
MAQKLPMQIARGEEAQVRFARTQPGKWGLVDRQV